MPSNSLAKQLDVISKKAFISEKEHVQDLINNLKISYSQFAKIKRDALTYTNAIRDTKGSGIESFIQEYSLSNEEGVAIMCLAESLLRIPDKKTAKELVEDKLKSKNWKQHFGKSDSLFVNASTWGLMLTGKVINFADSSNVISKLINKMGEPVILASLKKAIMLISNEFIMGSSMPSALKTAKAYVKKGYRISFDILGESSRTEKQAQFYYDAYIKAISDIAKMDNSGDLYDQTNLSVKLTALHPKVMLRKEARVMEELMPRLVEITKLCRDANITISFDAEESYRQDIYLKILTSLISHKEFKDYNGIGFVIQGYQKRAFDIIDYIADLGRSLGKRIPVRLVKGAYWDTEIKHAQEQGLPEYPVFTRKEFTDTSYLACAQKIINNIDVIYPQFATHNAYTIAAIKEIAGRNKFEFQKLQGMGNSLHDKVIADGNKCRIYAPVGKYEDLLAYLMRRLLENGANTSFVNLVGNPDMTTEDLVANPVDKAKKLLEVPLKISLPSDIYGAERKNSEGMEAGMKSHYEAIVKEIEKFTKNTYEAISIIDGKQKVEKGSESKSVASPTDNSIAIGTIHKASEKQLLQALEVADSYSEEWVDKTASERAKFVSKVGDVLHENRFELYSLLMKEAGKNIDDAISEVREAIDFARYYAAQALKLSEPITMPGYTGESNHLSLHGRGTFLCISPWNFPLAIFAGQILAALASGNTVIAKAAENTSLIATFATKLIHKAGVPAKALQLVIAGGRQISETLIKDNRIKGVCFTGSTDTAQAINRTLAARNTAIAPLIAETGGQNAMIVDSSALLEQAADSIINSAFGSVGQRCSALRVVYIQEEIHGALVELLIGAMNELKIGNTQDLSYDLGPVISQEAKAELKAHIDEMKDNVIAIHNSAKSKDLKAGSFFVPHILKLNNINELKKENFGPILHVISYKSKDLDKVIDEINSTGFGLTFGVQSRIEERINYIASRIKAGNIYANRTMIGAQVGTHPFGGENNSGTGFKAGGPHYLLRFMTERTTTINTTAIGGNIELLS
jgi:RHH-type transcriptional regulator, proline utilization regulon repressor / proline dehydrogenase / delta 1-pyrroline-5-carboxylate dehydrogenase